MKNLTMISIFAVAATLSACDKTDQANQKTSTTTFSSTELKINNWGPQSAKTGTNPNKQPDGSMGIWIEVSGTQGLGEVQVQFAGQSAKSTSVQEKLITAAIAPEQLAEPGDKEVAIKQLATNKIYSVGVFKVATEK